MSRPLAVRHLRALVLLSGLAACKGLPSLPPAPGDLSAGISLYEHANFDGASALIQSSARRLRAFDGPCEHTDTDANGSTSTTTDWNDCLSSIRVAPGWRAILYTNDDFKGQSLEVTGEVANLQLVAGGCDHDGLNDCVSSIAVIAP